ncbi:DUF1302 domain-containing protein [Amphritea sp.]|uniref:DUF1302 domain-containing protein n=1 Tax=Amphritea sp. TaxID=1872502 RepID=UPI003A8DD830
MNNNKCSYNKKKSALSLRVVSSLGLAVIAANAEAVQLYQSDDVSIRWDNNIKYSAASSVAKKDNATSAALAAQFRNDGYDNFDRGLISNRIDLLSELDVKAGDIGFRLSGAAWYDDVYSKETEQNTSFHPDVEDQHGSDAELLDAFLYGQTSFGGTDVSVRLGRHSLVWGESLFLATNGMAYANGPLNLAKALAVPNTQAKELFLPVNQISMGVQPTDDFKVEAYYQFEWEKSRIPGAGSYFSDTNFMDKGGSLDLGYGNLAREDYEASDDGQWGIAFKYFSPELDTDFGLYYMNYHEKIGYNQATDNFFDLSTVAPVPPSTIVPGSYGLWFPEDITMIGLSASTTVGTMNVAGEISVRKDTPLLASPFSPPSQQPYGDSFHYQISGIYIGGPHLFWDSFTFIGEIGGHKVTDVTKNEAYLWPGMNNEVLGTRFQFIPAVYQVLPGLDIETPLSVGHNFKGYSQLDPKFNGGSGDGAGDVSLGVDFTYQGYWKGGVSYTHYYGDDVSEQALIDRDFISFNINRTF